MLDDIQLRGLGLFNLCALLVLDLLPPPQKFLDLAVDFAGLLPVAVFGVAVQLFELFAELSLDRLQVLRQGFDDLVVDFVRLLLALL